MTPSEHRIPAPGPSSDDRRPAHRLRLHPVRRHRRRLPRDREVGIRLRGARPRVLLLRGPVRPAAGAQPRRARGLLPPPRDRGGQPLRVRRRHGRRGLDRRRAGRRRAGRPRAPAPERHVGADAPVVGHASHPRAARALQARAARLRPRLRHRSAGHRERERHPAQPAAGPRDRGARGRDRHPDDRPPSRLPLGAPALPRERRAGDPRRGLPAQPPGHPPRRHQLGPGIRAGLASRADGPRHPQCHGVRAAARPARRGSRGRPRGPRRARGRAAAPPADAGDPAQGDRARDRVHAPPRQAGQPGHLARRRRRGARVRGARARVRGAAGRDRPLRVEPRRRAPWRHGRRPPRVRARRCVPGAPTW